MEIRSISLKDPDLEHGIYVQCLRLRRSVFIDHLGWNLTSDLGCEFDEYDTPAAIHIVALENGIVVGCMRMMRTDNRQGQTTYMILDAHRGNIPNLPSGLLPCEIVSPKIWEASRLAISPELPLTLRNSVLIEIVRAGLSYVETQGGHAVLGMMSPVFRRFFERKGLNVAQFGPTRDQRDGPICVLRWDISQPVSARGVLAKEAS